MTNKQSKETKKVEIDTFAIVAKLSDGTYHEVLLSSEDRDWIISLLKQLHKKINVYEKPLDGITLEYEN